MRRRSAPRSAPAGSASTSCPTPATTSRPSRRPTRPTVRDQEPVIADVLSNDYSPAQRRPRRPAVATAATRGSGRPSSRADGSGSQARRPLTGDAGRVGAPSTTSSATARRPPSASVSVVQKPRPEQQALPTSRTTWRSVRVGDAVTHPGARQRLDVRGHPAQARPRQRQGRSPASGQAFASGTVVRYVPDVAPIAHRPKAVDPRVRHLPGGPARPGGDRPHQRHRQPAARRRTTRTSRRRRAASRRASRPVTPSPSPCRRAASTPTGTSPSSAASSEQDGDAVDLKLGRVTRLRRRDDPLRGLPAQRRHRGDPLPAARPVRR